MKRRISYWVIHTTFLFTVFVGLSGSTQTLAADRSAVEDFVTRFYQLCLGRTPDQAGLDGWVNGLQAGSLTGSDVAYGFVFSAEFLNKNTNNEEYLTVLYKAFFNRQPDVVGWQGWLDAIAGGSSRQDVLDGFIFAVEFAELCDQYGIRAFEGHVAKEQRALVEAFVTRFYQLCLGRDPDSGGLQVWADNLLGLVQTGADVAYGFVFSQEFLEKNTSNEDYLTILYKAFFDRQPDQAGSDTWLAELDGGKVRLFVLNGFIYSQEFSELCRKFGITPFSDPDVDSDGDGFSRNQGDCNDKDPNTYPGAVEGTCSDGIDQDCDGIDLPCPCNDVAERGFLNVLNINLLFSEVQNRDERLEDIADFVADNNVDVLLLQEVVTGFLLKTENSAQDLREILRKKHNMDYNIRTAFEIGLPGLLAVANAVLSRCEIEFSQVTRLPATSELEFEGQVIPISRNVIMARLKIPKQGNINIYDTHLCARCEIGEREEQLDELLEFVNRMEMNMPGDNPSVLGGDFNSDRFDNEGAEKFLYEKIITAGFIDAYAEFAIANSGGQETLDTLCEDEDNADEHCTVGVSELDGPNAKRIDYIFTRRPSTIRDAKVVFNTLVNDSEPTVSDHAGVFTSMNLP